MSSFRLRGSCWSPNLLRGSLAVSLVAVAVLNGCVALGWRFGPGFACSDGSLFAEPPIVESRGDDYFLSWTQGTYPYFFLPNYRAVDGRLVVVVQGSSSTANLGGRHREEKIDGAENIQALKSGGVVYWEPQPEPGGRFVALQVVTKASAQPLPPQPATR